MKRISKRVLEVGVFFTCVSLVSGAEQNWPENLLSNPGFEENYCHSFPEPMVPPDSWSWNFPPDGAGMNCSPDAAYTGGRGLWIYTASTSAESFSEISQEIPVVPGFCYQATAFMRYPGSPHSWSPDSYAALQISTGGSYQDIGEVMLAPTDWAPYGGYYGPVPAGVTQVWLRLQLYKPPCSTPGQTVANFDDVCFVPVDPTHCRTPSPTATPTATPRPSSPTPTMIPTLSFDINSCWICYSPLNYNPLPVPPIIPPPASIQEDLQLIRQLGFDGIITYGNSNLADIPQIASQEGLHVIFGVWDPTDYEELDLAITSANYVDAYCIGNEGMNSRYFLTDLLSAFDYVRNNAPGKSITTAEQWGDYFTSAPTPAPEPTMVALGDWLSPIVHPYWDNHHDSIEQAVQYVQDVYTLFQHIPDRHTFIKEVGLPTAGNENCGICTEVGQCLFFHAIQEVPVLTHRFAWFEFGDQYWKHAPTAIPDVEPYWGIVNRYRAPKPAAYCTCWDPQSCTPCPTITSTLAVIPTPSPTPSTPTDTPTATPSLTPSPTTICTDTPTNTPFPPTHPPTMTPTPTSTPHIPSCTPSPPPGTPTPLATECQSLGVTVEINQESFSPGDLFKCEIKVCNPGDRLENVPFVAMLDPLIGIYWFWPGWVKYPPDFDYIRRDFEHGITMVTILEFTWPPTGQDTFGPIYIYSAMLNDKMTNLLGELGCNCFTYGPPL